MAIYLGGNSISEIYLGSQEIKEVYLGSQLVYQATEQFPAGTLKFSASGGVAVQNNTGYTLTYSETLDGTQLSLAHGLTTPGTLTKVYIHGVTSSAGSSGSPAFYLAGTNVKVAGRLVAGNSAQIFNYFFQNTTALIDAKGLTLAGSSGGNIPASGFANFFNGCTNLQYPPVLEGQTVGSSGYAYMFYGCTALKKLPDITATTFEMYACRYMFANCTNIVFNRSSLDLDYRIPKTGTGITGIQSLQYMFQGCGNAQIYGIETPTINTTYRYSPQNS